MKRIKGFRSATQCSTAALLLGIAFAAGADQMMRALPAPAVALPAVQQIAAPVAAQPATPTSQIKLPADSPTSVKRPAVGGLSDATKARLKNAGLDATDPGLTAKLQAKLLSSGASFRSAHLASIKIVPKQPQLSNTRSMGGGAPAAAATSQGPQIGAGSSDRISTPMLPGVATFVDLYLKGGSRVTGQPLDPTQPGYAYVALVSSPKMISELPGSPDWGGFPSVTYSGACGANSQQGGRYIVNANSLDYTSGEYGVYLPRRAPTNGKWYYYVDFHYGGLDLGASPKKVTVSIDLGKLGQGSFSIPALSRTVTATITLTIDEAPPFVTNNDPGIGKGNGLFANPGATRLDPGTNPNASTSGDDVVGLQVNLGTGWSVTSTKIFAAHSVLDAPNDNTPENSYRGATVTQLPQSNRLQTTVHWHYGPAESLSYTIEWQLQGPGGQRPLMTMPLGGPCDS